MPAPGRIGLVADTHSTKPDGSDLPTGVLDAFKGVDLIVHLGDVGRKGILDRLGEVAPVWVPFGGNKGYLPAGSDNTPVKVVEAAHATVGLWFNLAQPDKLISVGDAITFDDDMTKLLTRRFKQPVDVVAFAGTHVAHESTEGGVLFVNPGSPTLPSDGDSGSVAILDLRRTKPSSKVVRFPI